MPPLALRILSALLPACALAGCGTTSPLGDGGTPLVVTPTLVPPTSVPTATAAAAPAMTVAEIYRSVEAALVEQSAIYHAAIERSWTLDGPGEEDDWSITGTTELWVDPTREVAREQHESLLPDGDRLTSTSIVHADATYRLEDYGGVSTIATTTCHGAGVIAALVLGCPGPTETSATTVEAGELDGRQTVVLLTAGKAYGSDETDEFVRRLHLDPETLRPIAAVSEGTRNEAATFTSRATYTDSFEPSDSLPADFFDPASIGYVEPDVAAALGDPTLPIVPYWLGERFEPSADLEPLVLIDAQVWPDGQQPGYLATLTYALERDRYGPPALTLELWPRATWDGGAGRLRQQFWDQLPCGGERTVPLADGSATIVWGLDGSAGFAPDATPHASAPCPAGTANRYGAVAILGDTVVVLDAPGWSSPTGEAGESPYDSAEGMQAALLALVTYGAVAE